MVNIPVSLGPALHELEVEKQNIHSESSAASWSSAVVFWDTSDYFTAARASRHEEDVTIFHERCSFCAGPFWCRLMLIFTATDESGFRHQAKAIRTRLGSCIVMAGLGILLYEWLKRRLRDYGYGF